MSIHAAVLQQFNATWRELAYGIEHIPEEHWSTGDIDHLIPARQILHAINTVDGYFREDMAESWNARAAAHFRREVDWEDTPADELPDKAAMKGYLDVVGEIAYAWLDDLSDEDWLNPQDAFQWTGPNILSRVIYVIRHTQGHIQECNAELRRRGLERIKWMA